jgi:hypothetical protein
MRAPGDLDLRFRAAVEGLREQDVRQTPETPGLHRARRLLRTKDGTIMTQPPDNQGLGQPRYDDPLSPGTPVPGSVADIGREPVDYPVGTGAEYPVGTGVGAGSTAAGTSGSTKDVAKEQAADVKESAKEKAADVAGTAKEQAGQVTAEAQRQAKDLLQQGRSQVRGQARQQTQRVAGSLHTLADELRGMAEGRNEAPGVATDLAREASDRIKQFASRLDDRDPAELLDEVRRFARQRPGTFLGIAAVAGVVAGRLTRGVKDASSGGDSSRTTGVPVAGAYGTPETYGTSASGGYTGTAPVGDYGTTTSTGYGTGTTGVPGTTTETTPFGDPEAYDVKTYDVPGGGYTAGETR